MGILSAIVCSWRKSKEIQRLERVLGSRISFEDTIEDTLKQFEARGQALGAFLDLCERDRNVNFVMRDYDATREDLKEIYSELISGGAGQWVKSHFVAASALAYAQSLAYCLQARANGTPAKEVVAYAMIKYFRGSVFKRPGLD